MNITREEKKEKALEIMKTLNIYMPYIKGFREENTVCYFEEFAGFWAYQDTELMQKVQEFEKKHNCLVYAITHEFTEFGELYDFLIMTDYKEEWDTLVTGRGYQHYAYAYVWNKDDEWCSEFGTIGVISFGGGIKRIS